jgi:hypothetical protein
MSDEGPLRPLGRVEIDSDEYEILEVGIQHYRVVRIGDGRPVGVFRGSPTSMWLLEPEGVTLDFLRSIVLSAIDDGVLVDMPTD